MKMPGGLGAPTASSPAPLSLSVPLSLLLEAIPIALLLHAVPFTPFFHVVPLSLTLPLTRTSPAGTPAGAPAHWAAQGRVIANTARAHTVGDATADVISTLAHLLGTTTAAHWICTHLRAADALGGTTADFF